MNGEYPFSTTPGGTPGKMPKQYKEYPGGVESYDVYSPPITTLYSQVWWKPLEPVLLPVDMVRRYNGTGMAIVGWEIDQVRRTADGDVSVPISASYNHHYVAQMIGAGARFKKVKLDGPADPRAASLSASGHGHVSWDQPQYLVEKERTPSSGLPNLQQFSSGNGGEYRKTYHGFAPGYALVVDSPTAMQITPMQIDTWNRDAMNISGPGPTKFVPGPLPRASLAPKIDPEHSGLLECPMTTRLTKKVDTAYAALQGGACDEPILTFQECWEAAAVTLTATATPRANETGADVKRPSGCSANASVVFFNEIASSAVMCATNALCICPKDPKPFGDATGSLRYHATSQPADVGSGTAAYFGGSGKKCAPWPSTTLLEQRNPTCDIRHYRGGQWACNHNWSLLDADQSIPWADQPLVFHHKYRFWVQPYDAAFHQPLTLGETVGSALLLGSPWEYDVPQCADGVAGCSYDHTQVTWIYTVTGNHIGKHTFVSLNNHCHAPTCLSVEVYACSKTVPLEQCSTTNGKLICRTAPVYGGSGDPAVSSTPRFDEAGYIAIPDCLWGAAEYGLEAPLNLTGVPLHVIKTANATNGHYGEMSGGQPWVII